MFKIENIDYYLLLVLSTFRNVIPVRTEELEFSGLNELKQLRLIAVCGSKRGEAAQQDVRDHPQRPNVYF